MLIFLMDARSESLEPIMTQVEEPVLDYRKVFPQLKKGTARVVPWYEIKPDPEAFGALLLTFAAKDPVCMALVERARSQWQVDFAIKNGQFTTPNVQQHYLKQLRNWLSPLSGNLGRREAHLTNIEAQFSQVWERYGIKGGDIAKVAALPFFKVLNVAGRRDRAQIYRNVTEAARALVGEVTSWPSRQVEKLAALSLLRSPGLARLQRRMLCVAALAHQADLVRLKCSMWEYLPYYLRGKPLEDVAEEFAAPRVLGALHDCLGDDKETADFADASLISAFKELAGGREYERWRLLPEVIRYQVMLSDLARILPGGKVECEHMRLEFHTDRLKALPKLGGFSGWEQRVVPHQVANPHDPGRDFPFAAGWVRNEFCPNVVSSRLLLAPLYAGTSGHTQGRILGWRGLEGQLAKVKKLPFSLSEIPVGVVIAAGYSVLWRLYYDKRVSGFHTMFEALQGTHVDKANTCKVGLLPREKGDDAWNILLECSPKGLTAVDEFWTWCLEKLGSSGVGFNAAHKEALVKARALTAQMCPGTVIPNWSETEDQDATGAGVAVWTKGKNEQALLRVYEEWTRIAASIPLPEDDGNW